MTVLFSPFAQEPMRRYEESRRDEFARMVELGHENQQCLDGMSAWCNHVEIVRESGGLYAQMSGLPIASHSIACPHVEGKLSSMNLRWVFSDFLRDHCDRCPHHSPSSDPTWGHGILQARREAHEAREKKQAEETARIAELRADLAERSRKIGESAPSETHKLLQFLEQLFSEDATQREEASKRLVESANLASDLFPKESVALLIALASTNEHAEAVLPTCIALARSSEEVRVAMLPLAMHNIENELQTELSTELLDALGEIVEYPLSEARLVKLIHAQRYDMDVVFWHQAPPNYTWHLISLQKSYDAEPERVGKIFQAGLLDSSDRIRVRYCGVLRQIQKTRPTMAMELLDTITQSLNLFEKNDGGSATPSAQLVRVLKNAFRFAPEDVDQHLSGKFANARPTVKEDLIRVYADQFDREEDINDGAAVVAQLSSAQQIAFERLFGWTKQEVLELDLRAEAANALEDATSRMPNALTNRFDGILGYLAMIVVVKEPPEPPPKIVIPGETDDPRLAGLQEQTRRQEWLMLKDRLTRCLRNLVGEQGDVHLATVAGCIENPNANVGEELKAVCMTLLGSMGENFQVRGRVLPLLMKGLMDYESVRVRGKAIDATRKMFRYSESPPPSNIIDVVNVHLRDDYKMVHKAAVQLVSRSPRWFDEKQAFEAMFALAAHVKAYQNDPYQMDNICDAVLVLARRHQRLLPFAIQLVASALPTGERHPDKEIITNLVRTCPAVSPVAGTVAILVAEFLARMQSDRINGYEHDRQRMFEWLHQLPSETYQRVAKQLLDAALQMAQRDYWEVCHFSSLFVQHGDFAKERLVVRRAREAIPEEPRHKEFRRDLVELEIVASGNALLVSGDTDSAAKIFVSDGENWS